MNRIGPSIIHRLIYLKLQTPNLPNWQTMPKITNSKSSIHSKWSSNTPWFTSSEFRPYKAIRFIISVSKEHTIQSSLKKPHTHLFFSFLISTYSSFFFYGKTIHLIPKISVGFYFSHWKLEIWNVPFYKPTKIVLPASIALSL